MMKLKMKIRSRSNPTNMKVLTCKWCLLPNFQAINLFGFIITRPGKQLSTRTLQHEYIHTIQMREMLWIFFYLWYGVEWFIRLFFCRFNGMLAYRRVSFEQEARNHEKVLPEWLPIRPRYNWTKYLKKR